MKHIEIVNNLLPALVIFAPKWVSHKIILEIWCQTILDLGLNKRDCKPSILLWSKKSKVSYQKKELADGRLETWAFEDHGASEAWTLSDLWPVSPWSLPGYPERKKPESAQGDLIPLDANE